MAGLPPLLTRLSPTAAHALASRAPANSIGDANWHRPTAGSARHRVRNNRVWVIILVAVVEFVHGGSMGLVAIEGGVNYTQQINPAIPVLRPWPPTL